MRIRRGDGAIGVMHESRTEHRPFFVRWPEGTGVNFHAAEFAMMIDVSGWTILPDEPVSSHAIGSAPASNPPVPWSRATSRQAIDAAIAHLRGQPFAVAIQRVLLGAADSFEFASQAELDAAIAACRAWEARRTEVAPGRRDLSMLQWMECYQAARVPWVVGCSRSTPFLGILGEVYEGAR
jgi:hypothetical protein